MSDGTVFVKLLRPGARLPFRATPGSSGVDLHACLDANVEVTQHPVVIPTGLAMAIPPGFDAQIRPRSGLTRKGVVAAFGTLDADYRGEIMVTLYTTSPGIRYVVHHGDRIGQLVIARLAPVAFEAVESLDETERGAGGHGSTGR
ncbi:MAG: dUTP diphosphatase [Dehalococcoidia bacterium]|nr:dUTP diphosphatase [Dehalococcoidia bacterium]